MLEQEQLEQLGGTGVGPTTAWSQFLISKASYLSSPRCWTVAAMSSYSPNHSLNHLHKPVLLPTRPALTKKAMKVTAGTVSPSSHWYMIQHYYI